MYTYGYTRPPIRPWIWFQKLGRQFDSPLVYLNLAGQDTIIINDYNVAIDIVRLFLVSIIDRLTRLFFSCSLRSDLQTTPLVLVSL